MKPITGSGKRLDAAPDSRFSWLVLRAMFRRYKAQVAEAQAQVQELLPSKDAPRLLEAANEKLLARRPTLHAHAAHACPLHVPQKT